MLAISVLTIRSVCAAPIENDSGPLDFKSVINPDGSYEFSYSLLDGTLRQERGEIVYDADGVGELKVSGLYSYFSPNNEYNEVRFTSDRNGYHPSINNEIKLPNPSLINRKPIIDRPPSLVFDSPPSISFGSAEQGIFGSLGKISG